MLDNKASITVINDRQIRFSVPADLRCLSTYVLLEQHRWFEKEIDFIYLYAAPGMTALDIGANIGVYTLPLAELVGPGGQVVAYEPGAISRQHLERSVAMNHCSNVTVSGAALSDFSGRGWLKIEKSGEMNQLVAEHTCSETEESVDVTTLDNELDRFNWTRVDFMKIDAEGHETSVINGGHQFFKQYSPLILFEVNHKTAVNYDLIEAFRELEFSIYRLLGDGTMLVPAEHMEEIDYFEVNLFAARAEQARSLADSGLLALPGAPIELSDAERTEAVARYCELPFAQAFEISDADVGQCPFGDALVAYSAYRFLGSLSPDRRFALLQKAYDDLLAYCETTNSPAALSSLSRVAHDLGHRRIALEVFEHFLDTEGVSLDQPFFPPSLRFENLQNAAAEAWFGYAVKEVLEIGSSLSSFCGHDMSRLKWLAGHAAASDGIIRRLVFASLHMGRPADEVRELMARLQSAEGQDNATWCKTVQLLMASAYSE